MKQVLLVEDSPMFGRIIKKKVETFFDIPVYWTKTLAETERVLEMAKGDFSVALLDFNLPDAPHGEVIDRVLAEGISSLVITGNLTDEVRKLVWSKKVVDYILKEDPNSLDYIISAMQQLEENQNTLILVVDDSSMYRKMISELLYVRKFRVITADDGNKAIDIIDKYPEVKLVITDYNMPGINGSTLCQKIREKFKSDQLAIIGISSESDISIGARFIKSGANDFIIKQSFLVEEFYCRVNHCLETLSLINRVKESAIRDFLTGLHNRRYFFGSGDELFKYCSDNKTNIACGMIDIDFFKKVNDTYGHDVGDQVIVCVAGMIKEIFEGDKDIVARVGGEEFCVLLSGESKSDIIEKFEKLRQLIEASPAAILSDGNSVYVTISAGVCSVTGVNVSEMVKTADELLYKAKEGGRNRVIF